MTVAAPLSTWLRNAVLFPLVLTGCLGDFVADPEEPAFTPIAFETVDPGGQFTCGLTTDGAPYCWGLLEHLLLPDDVFASGVQAVPAPLNTNLRFEQLTVGAGHACGVTSEGQAYCWGLDSHGQLGTNAVLSETCGASDEPEPCTADPVAVAGGLTFAALSAGALHTCGVTASGEAYCWGWNREDVLGTNEPIDSCRFGFPCSRDPARVASGLIFASISAGGRNTCAVTTTGAAYCWGASAPAHGAGLVDASEIPAGCEPYDTFADTTIARCRQPVLPVAGGLTFASVSVGDTWGGDPGHACGVTVANEGYCWGSNRSGQLGVDPANVDPGTPSLALEAVAVAPVPIDGGHQFAAVSAGPDYTCGVTTQGAPYCWGQGGDFSIGLVEDGEATRIASPLGFVPSTFDGPHVASVPGSVSVAVSVTHIRTGGFPSGERHTCAVGASGTAYCWGSNYSGQLGDGTRQGTAVPVQVAGEAVDES